MLAVVNMINVWVSWENCKSYFLFSKAICILWAQSESLNNFQRSQRKPVESGRALNATRAAVDLN